MAPKLKENVPVPSKDRKPRKDLYEEIVSMMVKKKMSERAIAVTLDISKSTVHVYLSKWKLKTSLSELKNHGRPKKTRFWRSAIRSRIPT